MGCQIANGRVEQWTSLMTPRENERMERLEELGITEEDITETNYHWPWEAKGTLGQND